MYRLISLLAASTALAGCMTTADVAPAPMVAEQAAATTPDPAKAAELGAYGFDAAGMDKAVLPGDNFYNHANGTWAKITPIPADKSNYGMFTRLDDISRERTRAIIEEQAKDPASKIGIAYNSFLDTAAIEAKGLAPLQPWLGQIKAVRTRADYAALAGKARKMGVGSPIAVGVGQDAKNPDRYIAAVGQSGLGMPDRDYYLSADPKMVDFRAKYVQHLTAMLTLAGEPRAAARARAILDFETAIARTHWTRTQNRDAIKRYNPMTRAQLLAAAKGYDMTRYLAEAGLANASDFVVAQPDAVGAIAGLIAAAPIGVLQDQMMVRSLEGFAPNLPAAFDRQVFSFYGTTLSGTPEQEVRWKRAVAFTIGALTDDVGKLYVDRHFTPETKAAADELVRNVVAAMGRRIDTLPWMAPETKQRARAKLANFKTKIGYPDKWQDYSALTITPGDAIGNAMRAAEWRYNDSISRLGGPIRRWEWSMTPMTINAYANPVMQEIVFPAAILQPPFFDPNADPAINYGGIGAVIGHEISHHFDDQGSKYDENGRLATWWTPADVTAFNSYTKKLVDQYDAYEVFPGARVQGPLTLGENIGDLAGLTVAYDAYRATLNGAEAPVLDGTTGDQRFYLGWAQVWRRSYREAELRQRLLTDSHSPSEQRAAVVRNLDPWYSAFGVQPGQKLYLAPTERVRIW
jgi:putative endopeptidase